jgi:multisubunit Na+/H+ antiporter MnhE subunit
VIPRSLLLFVLWILLWGELSVANVASGAVVVPLVTWLFVARTARRHLVRPWGALSLSAHVLVSLVTSSLQVVRAVLAPTPARTSTSVQTVALEGGSPFVASVVANLITLTPGTLTLDVDPGTLVLSVHVLGEVDPAGFRREVIDLERRVARAVRELP